MYYFEVLKSWPRGRVAAWPQIKFLSTYPRGSVAAWPHSTFLIITFLRGCSHAAKRVSWQEFYLRPCAATTLKIQKSHSSYNKPGIVDCILSNKIKFPHVLNGIPYKWSYKKTAVAIFLILKPYQTPVSY